MLNISPLLLVVVSSVPSALPIDFNFGVQGTPQQRSGHGQWFQANSIHLRVSARDNDESTIDLRCNEKDDMRIRIEASDGTDREVGDIIVLSGAAMLTRGLTLEKGYEIDKLDSAVLMVQTVLEALSRAFPHGPASVGQSASVNLTEAIDDISVNTRSATSDIPAPWVLRGTVSCPRSRTVEFQLTLSYSVEDGRQRSETLKLSGVWQMSSTLFVLEDAMQVRGWDVYSLGPISSVTGEGRIYDYGAVQMKDFQTIGEVRKALRAKQ